MSGALEDGRVWWFASEARARVAAPWDRSVRKL